MKTNTKPAPEQTPLDRWVAAYKAGETTITELMRHLNAKAENVPHRLRAAAYCLGVVRDSKQT